MWRGQFVVVVVGLEGWVRLVVDGKAAAKELRKIEKSFRRNPAAAILHRASVKNDDTTPNTSNGIVLVAGKQQWPPLVRYAPRRDYSLAFLASVLRRTS